MIIIITSIWVVRPRIPVPNYTYNLNRPPTLTDMKDLVATAAYEVPSEVHCEAVDQNECLLLLHPAGPLSQSKEGHGKLLHLHPGHCKV